MNDSVPLTKRIAFGVLSIALAGALWLPSLHFFFREPAHLDLSSVHPKARKIAARQIELWTNPRLRAIEVDKMRHSNAEWDFMGRSARRILSWR